MFVALFANAQSKLPEGSCSNRQTIEEAVIKKAQKKFKKHFKNPAYTYQINTLPLEENTSGYVSVISFLPEDKNSPATIVASTKPAECTCDFFVACKGTGYPEE